jgi:hypothetical protein
LLNHSAASLIRLIPVAPQPIGEQTILRGPNQVAEMAKFGHRECAALFPLVALLLLLLQQGSAFGRKYVSGLILIIQQHPHQTIPLFIGFDLATSGSSDATSFSSRMASKLAISLVTPGSGLPVVRRYSQARRRVSSISLSSA